MWIKCLFFVWSVAAVTQLISGCQKQSNKDITGGQDLRSFSGKPETECCQLCKETPECKAYAWSDYQGGQCCLKSADGPIVEKNGVSIGIMDGGDQTGTETKYELSEYDVLKKTIYAEARGEPEEGQKWVAWVIKNRASKSKSYWGGNSIKAVCLQPGQFECWNGRSDIEILEPTAYATLESWLPLVMKADMSEDPTSGCDHYNNPDKEGYPPWTQNCDRIRKIGNHQFYRSK